MCLSITIQGAGPMYVPCTSCGQAKPSYEYSSQQLSMPGRQMCNICLQSATGGGFAVPHAPAAGEGYVRCVACCQLKPTSAFGVNQLRRRAGIERCAACVESDNGAMVLCTACHKQRPFTEFSKKQLACKPGSERCRECIEESSTG